jgi:AraC-like DNA-binding protein
MDTLIFNVNDLALLLLIAQCVMLTLILLLVRENAGTGNVLLAALLMTFALQALDTLMYWSVALKTAIAPCGVWPFWLFKWMPFAQGPLLYAYVRTKLASDTPVLQRDLKHWLPVFAYPLIVVCIFAQLAPDRLQQGIFDYDLWLTSSIYVAMLWSYKISALSYGIRSFWYLRRHAKQLEHAYSNPAFAQPLWLLIVVSGFVGLWFLHLIGGICQSMDWELASHLMGVTVNYASFGFITTLVFYSLLKSRVVAPPLRGTPADNQTAQPSSDDQTAAERLNLLLNEQSLFLNPELTVEDLARASRLPDRQVSYLINNCLGKNFFELVNDARVCRAKQLLEAGEWSIQRVLEESGFNSKATFNRIFKRYVGHTPSEYRKISR